MPLGIWTSGYTFSTGQTANYLTFKDYWLNGKSSSVLCATFYLLMISSTHTRGPANNHEPLCRLIKKVWSNYQSQEDPSHVSACTWSALHSPRYYHRRSQARYCRTVHVSW